MFKIGQIWKAPYVLNGSSKDYHWMVFGINDGPFATKAFTQELQLYCIEKAFSATVLVHHTKAFSGVLVRDV